MDHRTLSMSQAEQRLKDLNIRKTPIRMEMLEIFLSATGKALAHKDIEAELEDPDRITVYRTLKTFEQKGLIHQVMDGTGVSKYAICIDDCSDHMHHDAHAHFRCDKCGKTTCLDGELTLPSDIPADYEVKQAHLILEGLCASCTR